MDNYMDDDTLRREIESRGRSVGPIVGKGLFAIKYDIEINNNLIVFIIRFYSRSLRKTVETSD